MTSIPILNVNVRVGPPGEPAAGRPPRWGSATARMRRYSRASWTCSGGGAAAGPAAPRQVRLLAGGLFRPTW